MSTPQPPAPAPKRAAARPVSPCIGLCRIDPAHGWCEGCLRSLDEIAAWSRLGPSEREPIWLALPQRRRQAREARQALKPREP